MGRQAEAALGLFVSATNSAGGIRVRGESRAVELLCRDDESSSTRCAEIYRSLCDEMRVDMLLGPYSSELTRTAAPIAERARMLFVNHGGADDDIFSHHYRLIVGVLSPASEYFNGFVRLVAGLKLWRKRIAIVRSSRRLRGVDHRRHRARMQRTLRAPQGRPHSGEVRGPIRPRNDARKIISRVAPQSRQCAGERGQLRARPRGDACGNPIVVESTGARMRRRGRGKISARFGRGGRRSGGSEPVGGAASVPPGNRTDAARIYSKLCEPMRQTSRATIPPRRLMRRRLLTQDRDRKRAQLRRGKNPRGIFRFSHQHFFRRLLNRSRNRTPDRPSRVVGPMAWRTEGGNRSGGACGNRDDGVSDRMATDRGILAKIQADARARTMRRMNEHDDEER